jgi:hypothetical protein
MTRLGCKDKGKLRLNVSTISVEVSKRSSDVWQGIGYVSTVSAAVSKRSSDYGRAMATRFYNGRGMHLKRLRQFYYVS